MENCLGLRIIGSSMTENVLKLEIDTNKGVVFTIEKNLLDEDVDIIDKEKEKLDTIENFARVLSKKKFIDNEAKTEKHICIDDYDGEFVFNDFYDISFKNGYPYIEKNGGERRKLELTRECFKKVSEEVKFVKWAVVEQKDGTSYYDLFFYDVNGKIINVNPQLLVDKKYSLFNSKKEAIEAMKESNEIK